MTKSLIIEEIFKKIIIQTIEHFLNYNSHFDYNAKHSKLKYK